MPRRRALALLLALATAPRVTAAARAAALSHEASEALHLIRKRGDNRGESFVIIDKRAARLWLFEPKGRLIDGTPVLLGLAVGDESVPGIGARPMAQISPRERTTPAGRFVAEPGRNASGEDVIWVDYEAAVSMHRMRATNKAERRVQRLASPQVEDNRISYGCINVPAAFYDRHLAPLIERHRPVVYVLPETRPVATLFER